MLFTYKTIVIVRVHLLEEPVHQNGRTGQRQWLCVQLDAALEQKPGRRESLIELQLSVVDLLHIALHLLPLQLHHIDHVLHHAAINQTALSRHSQTTFSAVVASLPHGHDGDDDNCVHLPQKSGNLFK